MAESTERNITFSRLTDISPDEIIAHMSASRVAEHMPLITFTWDHDAVARFIAVKEEYWCRDGLGHWAILNNDSYIGWGGFQKEGNEWDYGLVLKPECFGLGMLITKIAIEFAVTDQRIPYVTFLLPPSRQKQGALARLGAKFVDETQYNDVKFLKYRLDTK